MRISLPIERKKSGEEEEEPLEDKKAFGKSKNIGTFLEK
jgi:hypothetical protein